MDITGLLMLQQLFYPETKGGERSQPNESSGHLQSGSNQFRTGFHGALLGIKVIKYLYE